MALMFEIFTAHTVLVWNSIFWTKQCKFILISVQTHDIRDWFKRKPCQIAGQITHPTLRLHRTLQCRSVFCMVHDTLYLGLCHRNIDNVCTFRAFSLTSCCPPTWRRIAQTDLDIQGSHEHHACMQSSCAWTTNGEVHGETVMHKNLNRCLHKWILISVAIEAAMLEDSITSRENALYV